MSAPRPIIIVNDPSRLFSRGSEFMRHEFAISLWMACWPIDLVVRDSIDDRCYDVVQYETIQSNGTQRQHQNLLALDGGVVLRATRNGNLKREVQ